MAKNKDKDNKDKNKDKPADKSKDTKKDKKGGGGLLGRIFGGKKEDEGGVPATPATGESSSVPQTSPATPLAPFTSDGVTVDSKDPLDMPDGAATIPPGYIRAGKKGGPKTPAAPPNQDLTMPPAYAQSGGMPDFDATMRPGYARRQDEPGEMTIAPSYARPRTPPGASPGSSEEELGLTIPPTYADGDANDLTMPPTYAKRPKDPFTRAPSPQDQDMILTSDPDAGPTAPPPSAERDPFAFSGDDFLASMSPTPPAGPASPKGAPPAAGGPASDDLGFGADVPDLLAPSPSPAGAPGGDPFGAPLADDPFEVGAAPPPAVAKGRPAGHRTEELANSEIEVFDVELDGTASSAGMKPPPPPPGAPAAGRVSQEERTMEMERPAGVPGPREMQLRTTRVDQQVPEYDSKSKPAAPAGKALFASAVVQKDGSRKLGARAPEAMLDEATGVLFAPHVPGGWTNVPPFAAVLSCGSVVGRLPKGTRTEPDRSLIVPPPAKKRAFESDSSGPGRRASPFPEGVVVEKTARIAYAPPDVAAHLEGSPEPMLSTEDGGLLLFVAEGARWNADGSYALPPEPPKAIAIPGRAKEAPKPTEEAAESASASAHPAHGERVFRASYLGCEEVVFADGWASMRLPPGAKIERDQILLPPEVGRAPGARPELLEVAVRPDGWISIALPDGFLPESEPRAGHAGIFAWIAPAPIEPAEDDSSGAMADQGGEPTERLVYAGIEDSLLPNGWTRLDLPPGARVSGRTLRVPREYAHAATPRELAAFDRGPDGALTAELPANAEVLGSVVLIPPEGAKAAPRPRPAAAPAAAPAASATGRFKSVAPPDGGDTGSTRAKGVDRFRTRKSEPSSPPAEGEIRRDSPSDEKASDPKPNAAPEAAPPADAKPEDRKPEDRKPEEEKEKPSSEGTVSEKKPDAPPADAAASPPPATPAENAAPADAEKPPEKSPESGGEPEKDEGEGDADPPAEDGAIRGRQKKRRKS
jgi:hypothetical protein